MLTRETQADKKRERILHASAALFSEHGYAGVTMRKIAERCEMKAGSLYYHFSSKDQILVEVLNIGIGKVHAEVAAAISGAPQNAPGIDRLTSAIQGHLQALLEFSSFTSANVRIFRQVPDAIQQGNLGVRRAYEDLWDEFLQQLRDEGLLRRGVDLRSFRLMLLGALNATLEWFDPDQGNIDALAIRYADMLARGIMEKPVQ
jgi:AcrR family transcriptional regulator